MKKLRSYIFLTAALLSVQVFAFNNGSTAGSTPWTAPYPGAVYVSYSSGGNNYQKINSNYQVDVLTLKIQEIRVSSNYAARGVPVTVSYVLENTSTATSMTNIDPQLNFFQETTGNLHNEFFAVTRISPQGSYTLAPGATMLNVFLATPADNRPSGKFIVDGKVASAGPADSYWSAASIMSGAVHTGASAANYLYSTSTTLNLSAIEIIAPPGARDNTISAGQSFDISFNVQNLSDNPPAGTLMARIYWQGTSVDVPYSIGQPVNHTLSASAASGQRAVTVSLSAYTPLPTDSITGQPVGFATATRNLLLNVVAPAALDILNITLDPPTKEVKAYQDGPVTVAVQVKNTGGAGATVNLSAADLKFFVNNIAMSDYSVSLLSPASGYLGGGGTAVYNYRIVKFGGGTGPATVNVSLNALDENSAGPVTASALNSAVATYNVYSLLGISPVEIVSPAGAVDKIISSGQDFVISFNVQNLGGNPPIGNFSVSINWQGVERVVPYSLGVPVNYTLSANASLGAAAYPLAVSLKTPLPADAITGQPVSVNNNPSTITITVVAPAALDILNIALDPPTSEVKAYQDGPVTVAVQVRNTGTAGATVNLSPADLKFFVNGNPIGSYAVSLLSPAVNYLAGNNATGTYRYSINKFGGGIGPATVNVSLNALDENSAWPVTASASDAAVATYNVTANASFYVRSITVIPEPFKQIPVQVVAEIIGNGVGTKVIRVIPAVADLTIKPELNPALELAGVSFNVTGVISPPFDVTDDTTVHIVTYNVLPLNSAVSGRYIFGVKEEHPTASSSGGTVPEPSLGGSVTLAVYDNVSPNLLAATANLTNIAARVTAPTNNFYLVLEFNEEMRTAAVPTVSFLLNGSPKPGFTTGNWSSSGTTPNNIFTTATMNLTAANEGRVTVSLPGQGAQDLATNTVSPSGDFLVFFVDATPPTGAIAINNGETVTINPAVTVTITALDDNYTVSPHMFFRVSANSDVSPNNLTNWQPVPSQSAYAFAVTLNTDTLGTKNIWVEFRDEAGNISSPAVGRILLDSGEILWLYPPSAGIVSQNSVLQIRAPFTADAGVDFYVSVNGTLQQIASDVPLNNVTGVVNQPLNYAASTANAELIASVTKNGVLISGSVYPVSIDNDAPDLAISAPAVPPGNYVNGAVTISGTATDNNKVTAVDKVVIKISGGTASENIIIPGAGIVNEQWATNNWIVPVADADGTTYNIAVTAYDLAGNPSLVQSRQVLKTSQPPTINLLEPTASVVWLNNPLAFSGTVTSYLPLKEVLVTLSSGAVDLLVTQAIGTHSWQVPTFSYVPPAYLDYLTVSKLPVTLSITVLTDTAGSPITAVKDVLYYIDSLAPSTGNVPSGLVPAVGTYNIVGSFRDEHSGVGAVIVSVNNTQTTLNISGPANPSRDAGFVFPLAVNADRITVDILALDNSYPPNLSAWHSFVVSRDYSMLPTASISWPVSGDYVNNTMNVTGTARVSPNGTAVTGVWLRFTSLTSDSGWLTANILTAGSSVSVDWSCEWRVPADPPDAHDTTYNVAVRVGSSTGMVADVSPNSVALYIKDKYGPLVSFINMVDNMFLNLDPQGPPFTVRALTYTEGAVASAAYLEVDGARYPMTPQYALTSSRNIWSCGSVDFLSLPGNQHTVMLWAVDALNNWTTSNTLIVRTVPSVVITDPLPPGGMVSGNTLNYSVYATSLNTVYFQFDNLTAGTTFEASVGQVGKDYIPPVFTPGSYPSGAATIVAVSLNPVAPTEGIVYLINLVETSGSAVTIHYQPIVYDITPPTVNAVFNNVVKYYPGAVIAPGEHFMLNIIDRTPGGGRGSGFNYQPVYDVVSGSMAPAHDPVLRTAGSIQRSILNGGSVTNNNILAGTSDFDPVAEVLRFKVGLAQGTYDLAIDAVDNAGNALTVTFNVPGLLVNDSATGRSGTLDKSKFITAYPNPYNPQQGDVLFTYFLKDHAQRARIMVYNQVGELVHPINIEGPGRDGTSAGYNQVAWDGLDKFSRPITNGVYIYLIVIDGDKGQTFHKGTMAVIRN
ncbi:MAG: hypothetical protein LBQ83_00965 [Candidatus Margulisbacteria bacterium]|jgi:archaellum component FlaG (FlaF/FlaG flagellin family)|nr:hypothetical protein [Candidatus Margulisiibacteriota bacterium]